MNAPRTGRRTLRRSHSNLGRGRRNDPLGCRFRRLASEPLEDRCLLDATLDQQAIQLFNVSPALFAENLGQWSDPAVRYAFQGSGANMLDAQTGPVIQLEMRTHLSLSGGSHGSSKTLQTVP